MFTCMYINKLDLQREYQQTVVNGKNVELTCIVFLTTNTNLRTSCSHGQIHLHMGMALPVTQESCAQIRSDQK